MLGKTNTVHPGYGPLEIIGRIISGRKRVMLTGTTYLPFRGQILARGGSRKGYKFELTTNSPLQKGLTLHEDGAVSGIPLQGGSYSRKVRVTDSDGNTAEITGSFSVTPYILNWKVTDYKYIYDGKPHTVTLTPTNIPDVPGMPEEAKHLEQGVDYSPRYSIPNAGYAYEAVMPATYGIFPIMLNTHLGYSAGSTGGALIISASEDYTFNVQNETVKYDGRPHEIVPEIYSNFKDDDVIKYTTKYRGTNGTVYTESETPPTEVGKYYVTITVKSGCGYKPKTKYATLTITE